MEDLEKAKARATELVESLPVISAAMVQASEWLFRGDQNRALETAAGEVLKQAKAAFSGEILEQHLYLQQSADGEAFGLLTDVGKIILGGRIQPKPPRPREHPPFGRVRIAVGPGGIPKDMAVVKVSQVARQEGLSEGEVEQALVDQGYDLFNPDDFRQFVSWLSKENSLGRIRLPYRPQSHVRTAREEAE